MKVGDEGETTLESILVDSSSKNPYEKADSKDLSETFKVILNKLTSKTFSRIYHKNLNQFACYGSTLVVCIFQRWESVSRRLSFAPLLLLSQMALIKSSLESLFYIKEVF